MRICGIICTIHFLMNQSNSRRTEMKKTPKKIVLLMRRICGFTERVDELYQTRSAWNSCGGHIGLLDTHWISFLVAVTLIWFSSFLGYHTHLFLAWLCWQVKYHNTITLPCPFILAGWSVATEEKRKTIRLLLKAPSGTERLMQAVGQLHFSKRLVAT